MITNKRNVHTLTQIISSENVMFQSNRDRDEATQPRIPNMQQVRYAPEVIGRTDNEMGRAVTCRICNQVCLNRSQLFKHRIKEHGQYGRGRTDNLQTIPWNGEQEPFDNLEDGHLIEEVYENNTIFILTPHEDQYSEIRRMYNFPVPGSVTDGDITQQMNYIFQKQPKSYKVNISAGVILQNVESREYKYYRPGQNANLLEIPLLVYDKKSLEKSIEALIELDVNEAIKKYKPDSKYIVRFVTQVEYYVFLTDYALGNNDEQLPPYVIANKSIITKNTDSSGKHYPKNLCMFVALARHEKRKRVKSSHGMNDVRRPAIEMLMKWLYFKGKKTEDVNKFAGVKFSDLPQVERCFQTSITVMKLHPDNTSTTEYISTESYHDSVYLHVHEDHVSLITDIELFAKRHRCSTCDRLFRRSYHLKRHSLICKYRTKYTFPGGYYHQEKCIFERLDEVGIHVKKSIRNDPYFAVFDLEALLMDVEDSMSNSCKSKYIHKHRAVTCSVASNIPGFRKPYSLKDEDPAYLVSRMLIYMSQIRGKARQLCHKRWSDVLPKLDNLVAILWEEEILLNEELAEPRDSESDESGLDDDDDYDETENKKLKPQDHFLRQVLKLREDFKLYIEQLNILSFNGSHYDLNLVREEVVSFMLEHETTTLNELVDENGWDSELRENCAKEKDQIPLGKCHYIKRGNRYLSITCNWFRMLDVINFLAAGTSYSKFLKAFDLDESKYIFPYTYIKKYADLQDTSLPSIDHPSWLNDLRGGNLLGEEYEQWVKGGRKGDPPLNTNEKYAMIMRDWELKGWENIGDYLLYYNEQDVTPFVKGVEKLQKLYFSLNMDIFKRSIGIPSVSRNMLFNYAREKNVNFALCDNANKDLYLLFKKQLTAGPSIVYTRHMEVGVTKIHPEGEVCNAIEGYDFNSLYLSLFNENMPCGDYVRRFRDERFKPRHKTLYSKANRWLKYREEQDKVKIKSILSDGKEVRVGKYPLDGYAFLENGTKRIYCFDGCFQHRDRDPDCPITKGMKDHQFFRQDADLKTKERNEYLTARGYQLEIIRECEYDKLLEDNEVLAEQIESQTMNAFSRKHKGEVSKEQILQGVMSEELFGFLVVDIHVPDNLKPLYEHCPPLFCNHNVNIDDIGPHMKNHIQQNKINLKSRRLLISDMQAKEMLVSSELLKFYLDHGLVCTEIYQVVEFVPKKVFVDFVSEVTKHRIAGAKNPAKLPIADLFKCVGNSGYGSTLLNKFRYSRIRHPRTAHEAKLIINDPKFMSLTKLGSSEIYEAQVAPARVKIDIPIQIGVSILLGAKKKLLEFYYDFMCKYIEQKNFSIMQIDTDSYYFALSGKTLLETVSPEYREVVRHQMEGYCGKERHPNAFLLRTCCKDHNLLDSKFPGLLKMEYKCQKMVCLNSKTYLCANGENDIKFSCKGLNKNKVSNFKDPFDVYKKVLETKVSGGGENTGFKLCNSAIYTYSQNRDAFSYLYIKRRVLGPAGIYTKPLDITLQPAWQDNVVCIQRDCKKLSNHFKWSFKYGNQSFTTGMQAYVVFCVKHHVQDPSNYEELINQAMSGSSSDNLHGILRKVVISESWKCLEYSIMNEIVQARLRDIYGMEKLLKNTGDKKIINADKQDRFFGTGESQHVIRWMDEKDIPGRNHLGTILMNLREKLNQEIE